MSEDLLWSREEPLHWRWVGVGMVGVIVLHASLFFLVFTWLPPSATGLKIGLGALPYLLAGALVGILSRQRSFLDMFYASLVPASVFSFAVEVLAVLASSPEDIGETMGRVRWLAVLAPLLGYVLVGLLGAWFGERIGSGSSAGEPSGAADSAKHELN